jgi:hypothetical protein
MEQVGAVPIALKVYLPPEGHEGSFFMNALMAASLPRVELPSIFLFSSAHCSFAPSICLRFATHTDRASPGTDTFERIEAASG